MSAANIAASNEPLSISDQRRNMALYVACASLLYLAAPVVYVGIIHASLCNAIGSSDTIANLPSAAFYFAMTAPLWVAWRFYAVTDLKPVVVTCFLLAGASGLFVAGGLYLRATPAVELGLVVLHGAAIGATTGVTSSFQWEILYRGADQKRRGATLALAYGVGPLFAIVGSLGAQLVLSGEVRLPFVSPADGISFEPVTIRPFEFPTNFAMLFAISGPLLGAAAALAAFYRVPALSTEQTTREPLLTSLYQGSLEFFQDKALSQAMVAYLLVGAGSSIVITMTLYTPEALGQTSADFAGYQSTLRFAFKMAAGLGLGWLLTWRSPKVGVVGSCLFSLSGVLWVLWAPKTWFLMAFGLMGAGDLQGVYFPNYVSCFSRPDRIRQNLAYMQVMSLPISLTPALFGAISDTAGHHTSFVVAAGFLILSFLIALRLPS
jgi:hypothetical protein